MVGGVLDRMLLPRGHDNNIAPRLINRVARKTGHHSPAALDWLLGTAFHLAYGISWGIAFGLVRRWSPLPSLPLAGLFGGAIYIGAFSRFGAATQTGTERKPRDRPWQKHVSLVSVALTYALCLGVLYDRLTSNISHQALVDMGRRAVTRIAASSR
jgi:hypothetical protein